MNRLSSTILTLLISLGMGVKGLAQQDSPIPAKEIHQLIQRIESLEQTVRELRAQLQSQSTSQESPSNAQRTDAAQAVVPSPAQDTRKTIERSRSVALHLVISTGLQPVMMRA